jgi:alkyl sulfatase BDS1-like metallo-beta-lactamase superfamily hydrolase
MKPTQTPSRLLFGLMLGIFVTQTGFSQPSPAPSKPATAATKAANQKVLESLPFNNRKDFADADRGFMGTLTPLTIGGEGLPAPAWDMESYKAFIGDDKAAPDTVNPSLWRNAQLNVKNGLYKVADGIYQVRGFDITNITFVQTKTGWIVFDPLLSEEPAKAAYELISAKVGKRPVHAVVYSHSHIDHYGGARALVSQSDADSGKVKVIAPEGFTEHAVSENVIAGNAMSRRAIFMYGALLPRNATGSVNSGLGQTNSTGHAGLLIPNILVGKTGEEITVDGIKMVFQMTPGTEAPAEMNTFFPQLRAMWMAENATNTMHNVLTLRGAQVRDPLKWAKFLDETIELYGASIDVKFQSHHWPLWGNGDIIDYLKKQRDLYKYIHDQSVNLMNKGFNGAEIAEQIELPPELANAWPNRGYYGSLRHNSRAVYQRYMGWYDANPSSLNDLPPEPQAKKFVEYMGGSAAVMKRAKADFDKGEYRFVATAMKQVVFAEPDNTAAKNMLADTYEQLGYQAESGPWRGVYLQGAYELRNGVPKAGGLNSSNADTIKAMSPDLLFDYLAVRMNGPKAAGKKIGLNVNFTDLKEQHGLRVENAVLNHGKPLANPDVSISMSKQTLDQIQIGETTLDKAIASGDLKLTGNKAALDEFLSLLDTFPFWFNIVTP